jgi:hypothetical protein
MHVVGVMHVVGPITAVGLITGEEGKKSNRGTIIA